jgi:hypothetical protein
MSDGGKGGSGSNFVSYDYYGTIAGILRCGPIDTIEQVLVDGQIIWQGPINRTDLGVTNPYTLSLIDPTMLGANGYVRLYWGDSTQIVSDPALVGHPPYRGFAYMVFCNFLFGRERTTMGNVEVIAKASARPPNTVIAATGYDGTSGCVNPWAVLADFLSSIHGAALPASRLDAASWQAAHDYFAFLSDRRLMAYCSPMLTDQQQLATFCNDLLTLCDGGLRLKSDGTIEAFYYPVDPGDLAQYTVLNANDFESQPEFKFEGWDSVPTGVRVNFIDADNWFVNWSVVANDLRALQQAVEPRMDTVQLDFVTRQTQALKLAPEWAKRKCQPQMSATLTVRPERAVNLDGTPLRAGNRVLVDVQPEPGGAGLLQLCRVTSRRFKATGAVTLEVLGEVNQPVVPYVPTYLPDVGAEIDVAALAAVRLVPTPLTLVGAPAISVLASRGDDLTVGGHVLFDVAGGAGTFTNIGTQTGFAVPCQLAVDFAADDMGPIRVTILDTRDEAIALDQPNDSGSQNDELLLVVYHTDVNDHIDENADGTPVVEWMSIVSSAAVAGNTYDFTVLRGRLGTNLAAWSTNDLVWIIPKASLLAFKHGNFPGYVLDGSFLTFRVAPFSRFAEFSGVPADLAFKFPTSWQRAPRITWTTPAATSSALAGTGNLTPVATITDRDSNTVRITLYYIREDTGVQTKVFEVLFPQTGMKTLAECFALANVATPLNFPGQVGADTYYTLTVRAEDTSGNVTESRRNLIRAATGGGGSGFVPPVLNPDSDAFTNSIAVAIDTAAPATKLQYVLTTYGGALPGGGYTTSAGTHVAKTLFSSTRIWTRSGDGVSWSGWVFGDYLKQAGGLNLN